MKLTKTASGKTTVKMSRIEWTNLGKKAGWIGKKAQNLAGQDTMNQEVEAWVMQTGKPGVMDKWYKFPELAYKAMKGDQNAWNELLMKCGDQAMNIQGEPAGNTPNTNARPGTTNPW